VVPYYNAQIALEKHDTTRALADLSAVVAQQPRLADAQFLLGSTLLDMKQYQKAEAPLKRAAQLLPNSAAAWVQLCYLHDVMGNFLEAYSDCQRALAIVPNDAIALDDEASALIGLKKYDEAIAILQGLIKQQPQMEPAWNDLAQAYLESGRYKEAAAAYQQTLKINPKNQEAKAALQRLGKR